MRDQDRQLPPGFDNDLDMRATISDTTLRRQSKRLRAGSDTSPMERSKENFSIDRNGKARAQEHASRGSQKTSSAALQDEQQVQSISPITWFFGLLLGGKPPDKERVRAMHDQIGGRMAELESSNEALEDENRKLKMDAEEYKREVQSHLRTLQDQKKEIEDHHTTFLRDVNIKHSTLLQKRDDSISELRGQLETAKQDLVERGTKTQEALRVAKGLTAQLAMQERADKAAKSSQKYENEIASLKNTIKELQTARLRSVESARYAPLAASFIEHELTSILSSVKQWSQKHMRSTLKEVLTPKTFARFGGGLLRRGCVLDVNSLRLVLERSETMQKDGKTIATLMTAVLSFDIIQRIIGDPFFAFVGAASDEFLQESQGKALRNLLDLISCANEVGAERLRCEILRLLDPVGETSDYATEMIRSKAKESREAAAEQIASAIYAEFDLEMDSERATQAISGLQSIVLKATELSWSLWMRKSRIEVSDWQDVAAAQEPDECHYRADSKVFALHQLNIKDVDDDPKALDGRQPVLMCSPLVNCCGNADGNEYGKRVLIKKAVVWLG